MFKLIKLFFTDRRLLEQTLKEIEFKRSLEIKKANQHNLNLCLNHKQESNHAHYSEYNCNYCNAIKGIIRECDKDVLIDLRGK